jgi:surface polysaccharide O-acyltransferase-like enzyme
MEKVYADSSKITWIENTRLIAIMAVITVHIAAYGTPVVFDANGHITGNWWAVNFYESVCRCCVPLFVMITGSLLLPRSMGLKDFLKKRLVRILIPFVFWSLVYILLNAALKIRDGGFTGPQQFTSWFALQWLNGAEFHLWYVYMLIGLYLFIPILQPWIKMADDRSLLYFIGLCAITITLNQFSIFYSALDLRYFGGYAGYLVLGYYIADRLNNTRQTFYAGLLLFITGVIATFTGTFLSTIAHGAFISDFYNYLTLNVFLLSAGAFMLIKNRHQGSMPVFIRFRNIVNTYGFGIYLCHPLFITIMAHFKLNYAFITPYIGILLSAFICLSLSCMLIYALSKMPYGKYITT